MLWDLRLMLCMDHSSCPHNKPTARVHLSSEHIPVCLLQSPGTELEPPTEFDLDSVLSEGCALLTPSSLRSLQPHCTFSMTANFRNSNHTLGSFCPLLCLMLHVRVVRSLQIGKQCWGGRQTLQPPFYVWEFGSQRSTMNRVSERKTECSHIHRRLKNEAHMV